MRLRDTVLKPMHPEGRRFVGAFALATLLLFFLWEPLGWIGLGLTVWCYYFFRDPDRVTPERPGLLVSPADGIVSQTGTVLPPPELGLPAEPRQRVSVFMSVFDCHVNRMPGAGTVCRIVYRPGKFVNAALDKASEQNERNGLVVTLDEGGSDLGVVQIAGLVARRIVSFTAEGDHLGRGGRFGLIRFGSRLDIYLPADWELRAAVGQTMIAGETVIAERRGEPEPMA
ncbi:phosphatidylserine decarboxylase [Roseivivax sp. CAU 1761]